MLFGPSGKGQKKGEKGRFRPISRKAGQTPLKPPFVTPPFAATRLNSTLLVQPQNLPLLRGGHLLEILERASLESFFFFVCRGLVASCQFLARHLQL